MNQQSMWNHVDVAEQVKLCRTKMSTLANKWGLQSTILEVCSTGSSTMMEHVGSQGQLIMNIHSNCSTKYALAL